MTQKVPMNRLRRARSLSAIMLGLFTLTWRGLIPIGAAAPAASALHPDISEASTTATFQLQTLDTTLCGPWLKAAGDLNGDRRIDLIVGAAEGGGLVSYLNDTPQWRRQVVDPTRTFSTDGEVADVDGDGRNDIIAITLKPAGVVWYRNTTDGWRISPIVPQTWP